MRRGSRVVIAPPQKHHTTDAITSAMRALAYTRPDWREAYMALAMSLGIAEIPDPDPYAWEREVVAEYWRRLR